MNKQDDLNSQDSVAPDALPNGFRFSGIHCGIKQASSQEDLSLIVADAPCVAAGVYTKNQVVAAPVVLDRQRTPSANIRAVVVNSGNANACTGQRGMDDAIAMTEMTANAINANGEQVLVMSTGIIGEHLPMDNISKGIPAAAADTGSDGEHFMKAARGIMTTDTRTKTSTRSLTTAQGEIRIAGMAKGSGMIGPNMATMLGTIVTDASLTPELAQQLLAKYVDESFNSINVDGHTSTNDTVLLLASGSGDALAGDELAAFADALRDVCVDLAKAIVQDGEGASHLIEIIVTGAESDANARTIAEAIANSALVKTAFAGNDPNWGRIVSAAGYAGPALRIEQTQLRLNGVTLFEGGTPVEFDAEGVAKEMQSQRDVLVELNVGDGAGQTRFWTCDLTHEYVTINAEYHT